MCRIGDVCCLSAPAHQPFSSNSLDLSAPEEAHSRNVRAPGTLKFGYEGVFKISSVFKFLISNECDELMRHFAPQYRTTTYIEILWNDQWIEFTRQTWRVLRDAKKKSVPSVYRSLCVIHEPVMRKCVMSYANNKGANQPAHPRSLISAFVVRCLDSMMSLVYVTKISSLMLASVAAEAGLCLACSETPEDAFSHDVAHMYVLTTIILFIITYTVIFLSFRTHRSGQTVQTQIRLLYTVCSSLYIFWMHYC